MPGAQPVYMHSLYTQSKMFLDSILIMSTPHKHMLNGMLYQLFMNVETLPKPNLTLFLQPLKNIMSTHNSVCLSTLRGTPTVALINAGSKAG